MDTIHLGIERLEGLSIVHASGKINADTCSKLEEALSILVNGGDKRIVIDLDGVSYISSAGLRVILTAGQQLHDAGEIALTGVNDKVYDIIEIAGFRNIMKIYDNPETAKADWAHR